MPPHTNLLFGINIDTFHTTLWALTQPQGSSLLPCRQDWICSLLRGFTGKWGFDGTWSYAWPRATVSTSFYCSFTCELLKKITSTCQAIRQINPKFFNINFFCKISETALPEWELWLGAFVHGSDSTQPLLHISFWFRAPDKSALLTALVQS